jgi:hypothetical protein
MLERGDPIMFSMFQCFKTDQLPTVKNVDDLKTSILKVKTDDIIDYLTKIEANVIDLFNSKTANKNELGLSQLLKNLSRVQGLQITHWISQEKRLNKIMVSSFSELDDLLSSAKTWNQKSILIAYSIELNSFAQCLADKLKTDKGFDPEKYLLDIIGGYPNNYEIIRNVTDTYKKLQEIIPKYLSEIKDPEHKEAPQDCGVKCSLPTIM